MDAQLFLNIVSVVGSLASLVGIWIAVGQITRTRKAAEASQRAAAATQAAISRNVLLAEVSSCTRYIEELKPLVRNAHYDAALLRVTDLTAQVIQLQKLTVAVFEESRGDLTRVIAQLAVLRGTLERALSNSARVSPARVNSKLDETADHLNNWIGELKYLIGSSNDG